MKRLGIFSGKIYEDESYLEAGECCLCLTEQQAADEEYLRERRAENEIRCCKCLHCPASKKAK